MELARLFVTIAGRAAPLYSTLDQVKSRLGGFAGSMGRFHLSLTQALGLGGLGAAVAGAVREAGGLEKAYSQIRKTTGMTGDELARLRKELEAIATTMAGVSIEEVLDVAAMAGRLGISGVAGITSFTRAIAMIRIALDDIPAEEAATKISRILNVFRLGPDAALDFASALNKLDDSSTATGREILDLTQRLSGVASALGLTPQKALALASVMKDAGIETEVAGTGMSHVLMKMATDTEKFARVAGVSTKDFAAALKGDPLDALKLFMAGIAGMSSLERMKALKVLQLEGHMTGQTLLQLAQVMGKLDPAVAMANSEWESHASILKEVELKAQETNAQLTQFWNSTKLLATDLGALLLPAVKQLAGGMGELALMVRENFEAIEKATKPAVESIRNGIELVMVSLRNLPEVFGLVVVDIQESWDRMVAGAEWAGSTIGTVFSWMVDTAWAIGEAIFEAIKSPFTDLIPVVEGFGNIIRKALTGQMITEGDVLAMITPAFQKMLAEIPELKIDAFEFDASGFDAERDRLKGNMLDRETKRLDDKARAAAEAAKQAGKAEEGDGKAPEKDKKVWTGGLEEFAKKLQEGIFKKDDAGERTARNTGETNVAIGKLTAAVGRLDLAGHAT